MAACPYFAAGLLEQVPLGGSLTAAHRAHLDGCASCARQWNAARAHARMFAALATPHIPPALRDPSFLETVYEAATRTGEARVGAELRHVLAEDVVLPPSDIDWTAPVLERLEAGPTAETLRRLPRVESPGWIWPRVRRSALGPLLARRSHRNRAGRTRRLARVSALAAAVVLSAILLGRFAGPFFGTNGFSTGTAPETRNSSELEVVFHFTPTPLVEGYAPAAILDGRRG